MRKSRTSGFKDEEEYSKIRDIRKMREKTMSRFNDYGLSDYYQKKSRGSKREMIEEKDGSFNFQMKPKSPIYSRERHNYGLDKYKLGMEYQDSKKNSFNFDYGNSNRKNNFDQLNKIYQQKAKEESSLNWAQKKSEKSKENVFEKYNDIHLDYTPKNSTWLRSSHNYTNNTSYLKKTPKISNRDINNKFRYSHKRDPDYENQRSKSDLRYQRSQKEVFIPKKTPVKPLRDYDIFKQEKPENVFRYSNVEERSPMDLKLFNRRLEKLESKLNTIERKRLTESSHKKKDPSVSKFGNNKSKSSKEIIIPEPTAGSGDSFGKQRIRHPRYAGFKYSSNKKMSGTMNKYFVSSFDFDKKDDEIMEKIKNLRKSRENEEELRSSQWRNEDNVNNFRGSLKDIQTEFNRTTNNISELRGKSKSNRNFSQTMNNFPLKSNDEEEPDHSNKYTKLLNSGLKKSKNSSKYVINLKKEVKEDDRGKRLLKNSDYINMKIDFQKQLKSKKEIKNVFQGCNLKKHEIEKVKKERPRDSEKELEEIRRAIEEKYSMFKVKKEEKEEKAVERRNSFYSYNGEDVSFLEKIRDGDYTPSFNCPGFGKYLSDCRKQLNVVGDVKYFMKEHPDCVLGLKRVRLKRNFRSILTFFYFF